MGLVSAAKNIQNDLVISVECNVLTEKRLAKLSYICIFACGKTIFF